MPECLDCHIRVPEPRDWPVENGRRRKPCACGLPKAERDRWLTEQKDAQYQSLVWEWSRYSLTPSESVDRVRQSGNHEWRIVMEKCARALSVGTAALLGDSRPWEMFREDLTNAQYAAQGGRK